MRSLRAISRNIADGGVFSKPYGAAKDHDRSLALSRRVEYDRSVAQHRQTIEQGRRSRRGDAGARQLGLAVTILLATAAIGAFGYVVLEGWSLSDAL